MANYNSVQHAAGVEQKGPFLWATYEITAALSAADTVTFFEVPAGMTLFGGYLYADDLDTGTETLEIDIGDSSSTTRFLNSGVLTGDAVTGTKPEAGIATPLFGTFKDGPYTYTSATNVIGTFTAAAAGGGTGTLTLVMWGQANDGRVSPPTGPV